MPEHIGLSQGCTHSCGFSAVGSGTSVRLMGYHCVDLAVKSHDTSGVGAGGDPRGPQRADLDHSRYLVIVVDEELNCLHPIVVGIHGLPPEVLQDYVRIALWAIYTRR